jgi:hypothetical protein
VLRAQLNWKPDRLRLPYDTNCALTQVSLARIWRGIHFRYACDAVVRMGAQIAERRNNASSLQTTRAHPASTPHCWKSIDQ